MAYYTVIRFQSEYFLSMFQNACNNCHAYAVKETITQLKNNNVWKDAYIEHINEERSRIVTDSIQAFIRAFGSGKYADTDNPFWDEYVNSKVFNKRRGRSSAVYYRNKPYRTYDWKNDSREMIDRPGGTRADEWKNFPASKPHMDEFNEALDLYRKNFFQYFNSNEIQNLKTALNNSFILEKQNV